jgi:hypothetical protein
MTGPRSGGWSLEIHTGLEQVIANARRTGNLRGLRKSLTTAENRVAEAETIKWPALQQSWARDVERIQAAIETLQYPLRRAA